MDLLIRPDQLTRSVFPFEVSRGVGLFGPVKAVDFELISTDSHCHHSSAHLPVNFKKNHSSKVVTVPSTLCHSLSMHRRQALSPLLSLHFPRQSRSLLAADRSRSGALFSVNVLAAMCTLTACQLPDAGYQRV